MTRAKYIYKNKRTNKQVYSNKPLNDPELVLVAQYSDVKMKSSEARTK